MFATDLICSNGHKFEAWFGNHGAFEKQRAGGLISCPSCNDKSVKQLLSPLRIKKHADNGAAEKKKLNIAEYIEKHFEDVGNKFADEAMKIHVGDAKGRNIKGTATSEEEKKLTEEGVPFFKIPNIQ